MRAWVAAGLWLWVSAAWPAGVYKCTGPDGRTIYAQTPCAADAKELNVGNKPSSGPDVGSGISDADRALIEQGAKAQFAVLRTELPAQGKSLLEQHDEFNRVAKIAGATARIALQGPVLRMQDIYSATGRLPADGCFDSVRTILLARMRIEIDGYIAFMLKSEASSSISLMEAQRLDMRFWISMRDCATPAP